MNEKSLKQQVLSRLAVENVPANYDPWKRMQTRFGAELIEKKGSTSENSHQKLFSKQQVRSATLAVLILILIAATLFFTTPSGKVIAQSFLNLFTRADGNERTLPDEYQMSGITTSGLSIEEAEKLAEFQVVVPASLPDGYFLSDVIYNKQSQGVSQIYKFSPYQAGEMFIFTQQKAFPSDPPIGQNAEVEQIQIGNIMVESVIGSWFAPADTNEETWLSEAPVHTFRWQKDGFYFSLEFWINDTFSPAYLPEDTRQEMLEIFIGTRSVLSDKLNLNNLKSIEEAKDVSGMQLLEPAYLPEGWVFSRAVYEPENQRVVLIYLPQGNSQGLKTNGPSLVIFETPITPQQIPVSYDGYPPDALENITSEQFNGTFVQGALVDEVYDPEFGLSVQGQTDSLNITINFYNSADDSFRLDKEQLIAIAKSMG